MIIYVYGIDMDDIKNFNAKGILMLAQELQCSGIANIYNSYMNSIGCDLSLMEECPIVDFIDELRWYNGWEGMSGFLAIAISELEGIGVEAYPDESGMAYVGLKTDVPWNFNEKTRSLTEEELRNIIGKYVNQITDDIIPIKLYRISV